MYVSNNINTSMCHIAHSVFARVAAVSNNIIISSSIFHNMFVLVIVVLLSIVLATCSNFLFPVYIFIPYNWGERNYVSTVCVLIYCCPCTATTHYCNNTFLFQHYHCSQALYTQLPCTLTEYDRWGSFTLASQY